MTHNCAKLCNLQFRDCDFILRSSVQYNHHCNVIEENPQLSNHYSTTFGVNHRSTLESLKHFTVAEGAMIPDILHDVLEGVLTVELKLMLKVTQYY